MFYLYVDDKLFWRNNDEKLILFDATFTQEANTADSLSFTPEPEHPYTQDIVKLKSNIKLIQDDELLFKGRVISGTTQMRRYSTIECEGALAYFNDSIMRPFEHNGSIEDLMDKFITSHNEQVQADRKIKRGNITVTDPNNYIVRSSESYQNTLDALKSAFVDSSLGGYFYIRYSGEDIYLDYLSDSTWKSQQEIQFGSNMTDYQKEVNGSEIITAILPRGAEINDEEGNGTGQYVDIKNVNSGKDIWIDTEGLNQYGYICEYVEFDDITEPANLLTKAKAYVGAKMKLNTTYTIGAVDLHNLNAEIDKIKYFNYVKVVSEPHGLNENMLVTSKTMNLVTPSSDTLTLGYTIASFVESQIKNNQSVADLITTTNSIKSDYVINSSLQNIFKQLSSLITQTSEQITTQVSETYATKDGVTSEISTTATQLSDSFTFNFNSLQQTITDLNGSTTTQFQEINKYIRFINGHIIIGDINSDLQLDMTNDRLSFKMNNIEVAYMSNNNLYITNAEVLNKLQIGKFAFIPRENGSLSFAYTGGEE